MVHTDRPLRPVRVPDPPIAVPLAGAVTIAALPAAQQNDAQNRLEIMKDIVAALPTGQENRIGEVTASRNARDG